jgi:cytochrome c-type biogenesis protein CcmH/NrfG
MSQTPAASQAQLAAGPVAPHSPHAGAVGAKSPTLQDMKQMADTNAAPLLAKLKKDPNNTDLLDQVGAIYHATHQFKEAAGYYDRAVQIDPKSVALRTKLAISLYRSGDVDGAIAQLNRALSLDPKDANALFDLGMIRLQGKQDRKGALAAWRQLLKSNPQLSADRKAAVQKMMADAQKTAGDQHAG